VIVVDNLNVLQVVAGDMPVSHETWNSINPFTNIINVVCQLWYGWSCYLNAVCLSLHPSVELLHLLKNIETQHGDKGCPCHV